MADHLIFEYGDLDYSSAGDQDAVPLVILNGAGEDILDIENWPAEFKKLGLTFGEWKGEPYPLDDEELRFVAEDSECMPDDSHAYWLYSTVSLYKGRKWLSPFVEYEVGLHDPADHRRTEDEVEAAARKQEDAARRHLRVIEAALDSLPFDTMIELCDEDATMVDPFGGADQTGYFGYRMYFDMQGAMRHFGDVESYQSWMTANIAIHVIVEEFELELEMSA